MFEAIEKALAEFKAALDAVRNSKKTPEQIEKAKELYDSLDPGDRTLLEYIFPEVVEIEDERIRKKFLALIEWSSSFSASGITRKDVDEMTAYLEKQKEQNGSLRVIKDASEWEKIKEQKPAEIDEYEIIKKHITEDALSSEVTKRLKECGWYVTYGEPEEWSKEDKKMLEAIVGDIHCGADFNAEVIHEANKREKWLRALRPQPKPEWSEEDENMWSNLIGYLEGKVGMLPSGKERNIKWLKERFVKLVYPKSSWKPSEEEMDALHYVKQFDYGGHKAALVSLYEQLKKL